jgi:hypothetical protein
MRRIRITTILALSVLALMGAAPQSTPPPPYTCPAGIGADAGDYPFLMFKTRLGKELAFCGWSDEKEEMIRTKLGKESALCDQSDRKSAGAIHAAEYEVIDVATGELIITFGALDETLIRASPDGLEITQEFSYFKVDRVLASTPWYRYVLNESGDQIHFDKQFVFAPPKLTAQEMAAVLRKLRAQSKNEFCSEYLPDWLMMAALNGSKEAASALVKLEGLCRLDGESAEAYDKNMRVYREYVKNRRPK